MSANACDCACETPVITEIPGIEGAAGAAGANGTDGSNAFTETTAIFTVPAIGATETILVEDSSWMGIGQVVFIPGAGSFEVISKASDASFVGEYLDYDGNTTAGSNIAAGTSVSPGGMQITTPVTVANGGTGVATLTQHGVLVGNGAGNVVVTAAGAANTFLRGNGAAPPTYNQVTLTADVTGVLPVANGGTAGATAAAARAALGVGGENLSVYAAGTAYQFTNASALLNFGTTDPSITISSAGTWLLLARVRVDYNAATFAAVQTVSLKLRRTNNTAADITNSLGSVLTDIITTLTYTLGVVTLQPVIYTTANSNDVIEIFGDVSVVPSAGSLDAVEASILAVKLFT